MDFNALLKNKAVVFGTIGGVVLLVVIIIIMSVSSAHTTGGSEKKESKPLELLTTDNIGKALEIESLLAREGINNVERIPDGSKSKLQLKNYTMSQRDRALLTIVQSGIMDKNIGLEIFDKGDFTSSREDKRIRLARAVNGELARLIRKIEPIEDASVFVSIPNNSIFTSMQKPTTATVQVTIPSGIKLEKDKVRAITNLLLGSIQDLDAKDVSITDTNGNVYSSILSPENDMMSLLEEKDQYMKNKVTAQLDRLLGKGNYVVTVSTYLREAPLETDKIVYNPRESSVMSAQKFKETLGDKSQDKNGLSSAVSSYLPGGLPQGQNSASNRNYTRSAEELQYGLGKTQTSELRKPGMMEEISIAVTIDRAAVPNATMDELKQLVAMSASPKAKAANVEIAFADMSSPFLASDGQAQPIKPEESGNPWWTVAILLGIALLAGFAFITRKTNSLTGKQQKEIEKLNEKSIEQQNQIKEAQERAVELQTLQEQLRNSLTTGQIRPAISTLKETIDDIKDNIDKEPDEREFAGSLKSWIESAG